MRLNSLGLSCGYGRVQRRNSNHRHNSRTKLLTDILTVVCTNVQDHSFLRGAKRVTIPRFVARANCKDVLSQFHARTCITCPTSRVCRIPGFACPAVASRAGAVAATCAASASLCHRDTGGLGYLVERVGRSLPCVVQVPGP